MAKRIFALLLACMTLAGVLAGCGSKNTSADEPAQKQTDAAPAADSGELAAKYVYQAEFLDLPVKVSYVDQACVSGSKLFFSAYIDSGTALMVYDLDARTCTSAEYGPGVEDSLYANISALCPAADGGVWLLEQYAVSTAAAPDAQAAENETPAAASDGTGMDEGMETEMHWRILRLDADGKVTAELTPDLSAFAESYINTMYADKDDNLYFSDYSIIAVLDKEGQPLLTLDNDGSSDLEQYDADSFGVTVYTSAADGSGSLAFRPIDLASKGWGTERPMPANTWSILPGNADYDLLYDYNGNLFGWHADTDTSEKVVDWMACDVDSNDLRYYTVLSDGRVFALTTSYDADGSSAELILLSRVDASTVAEKTELTLACMNLDWNLRSQIVKFNRESDKYRIVVKDYSEYSNMTYESSGDMTMVTQTGDGLTKLNTEIMSGNVPDLLLTDGLPVRQYAAKGLLEDLYPYIDDDMSRDAFISEVLDADSEDGRLYELPLGFQIVAAEGLGSVVGGYDSWTLADLEDAMTKLNPDATIFNVEVTRSDILNYCLYMNADTFVDWTSRTASFDSPEFIDYLNFAAQFPAEFDFTTFDWSDYEQDSARMRNGDQLLSMNSMLYGFDSVSQNFAELGGDLCYIGLPSTSGHDGTAFSLSSPVAITTSCRDKDAAWSFLRSMLSDECQTGQYSAFPITKSAFQSAAGKAMEKTYELDENGDPVLDENGEPIEISTGGFSYDDGPIIEVYAMTEEQFETVKGLIAGTHRIMRYDESLNEIIGDETGAFFAGEKTAEETAKLIQNRVQLYLAEQD